MNELVVNASEEGLRIAILQDKRVVELHNEKGNKQFSVGDIFLGRVKKLLPGLNACFVEIGHPKDAFLHYTDLGPQLRSLQGYVTKVHESSNAILDSSHFDVLPEIDKHGKINQVLKTGSPILVQIVKEAISTKGPRLTAEISLPGQFLILVPFANEVSISRKMVSSEEKKRLRKLVESIKPQNFSVIVRTAAEGKDLAALKADLDDLISKWKVMSRAIVRAKVPKKVLAEEERTTSILRDMLSMGFDQITTDDQETFDDITAYLKRRMPDSQKILKFHSNKVPLFDYFGIEKQIKALFGKTVTMGNGAYLVIEHTEALHVIDVNSGSKNLGGQTLEETALKTNMEAATEIARQLQLRDMGGIIVVDFIDLKKVEHKKQLHEHIKTVMKNDRAKHSIIPMSKFGLVQITRQRVRSEMVVTTTESCPSCAGTGKMLSSILLSDEINANVDFLMRQNKEPKLTLLVNPYVYAHLQLGFMNFPRKWFLKYWKFITVVPDTSLGFNQVKYINSKDEEIQF